MELTYEDPWERSLREMERRFQGDDVFDRREDRELAGLARMVAAQYRCYLKAGDAQAARQYRQAYQQINVLRAVQRWLYNEPFTHDVSGLPSGAGTCQPRPGSPPYHP